MEGVLWDGCRRARNAGWLSGLFAGTNKENTQARKGHHETGSHLKSQEKKLTQGNHCRNFFSRPVRMNMTKGRHSEDQNVRSGGKE